MAIWLAVLPTIAVLGVTAKVVTMLIAVPDWGKVSIMSLSVLFIYMCLLACAVVGWVRLVAIDRRIASLAAGARS